MYDLSKFSVYDCINGNLLGDGCIPCKPENSYNNFSITQNITKREYIHTLMEIYKDYGSNIIPVVSRKPSKVNGVINHDAENWNGEYSYGLQLYTKGDQYFSYLRKIWYKHALQKYSQKIVPRNLRLTWPMTAIWCCDDGSNHTAKSKARPRGKRYFVLHTEGFSKSCVSFLSARLLKDLNINSSIRTRDNKYYIAIHGNEQQKLVRGIKDYVPWECFQYKLIERDRISINTSGVTGVSFHKLRGKWRATYKAYGQSFDKLFGTKDEAIAARKQWEAKFGLVDKGPSPQKEKI